MLRWTPSSLLLLVACAGDGASYTLTVRPHAPVGQDLFGDSPAVLLAVRDAEGVGFTPLGPLGGDATAAGDDAFGPLTDAFVGLVVQDDAGQSFSEAALVAFGEAGPLTLLDEQDAEVDVLVATVGAVGGLATLEARRSALGGALTVLPDGSAWLFGGGDHGEVQSIATLDAPSWPVDRVGELFDFDGNGAADARVGLTATLVDGGLVFVAGGRPRGDSTTGNSRDAALFDTATMTWTWNTRSMIGTRSEHRAVRLVGGLVLLVGGYSGDGVFGLSTWELFEPASRSFSAAPGALVHGALGFDVVPLASGSALVCGGGLRDASTDSTSPQDACTLLSAAGTSVSTSPLPVALQMLAMAPLGDGRVLACGGIDTAVDDGGSAAASDRAFVWDPATEAWEEVGALVTPRAGHRAIPLPDGTVAIVGGVQQGGLVDPVRGGPVRCAERYDPDTGTFVEVEPCGAAGSGDAPLVGWDDRHGAIVVSGAGADGNGGIDVGIVGFPPEF